MSKSNLGDDLTRIPQYGIGTGDQSFNLISISNRFHEKLNLLLGYFCPSLGKIVHTNLLRKSSPTTVSHVQGGLQPEKT